MQWRSQFPGPMFQVLEVRRAPTSGAGSKDRRTYLKSETPVVAKSIVGCSGPYSVQFSTWSLIKFNQSFDSISCGWLDDSLAVAASEACICTQTSRHLGSLTSLLPRQSPLIPSSPLGVADTETWLNGMNSGRVERFRWTVHLPTFKDQAVIDRLLLVVDLEKELGTVWLQYARDTVLSVHASGRKWRSIA